MEIFAPNLLRERDQRNMFSYIVLLEISDRGGIEAP